MRLMLSESGVGGGGASGGAVVEIVRSFMSPSRSRKHLVSSRSRIESSFDSTTSPGSADPSAAPTCVIGCPAATTSQRSRAPPTRKTQSAPAPTPLWRRSVTVGVAVYSPHSACSASAHALAASPASRSRAFSQRKSTSIASPANLTTSPPWRRITSIIRWK